MRILLATSVLLLLPAAGSALERLPRAEPADVGFSAERLARVRASVQGHVDDHDLAGAVTAIVRRGQLVHLETYGVLDTDSGRPMPDDALFRIASMTKTFTSVALMSLFEEARISLDDPVARYLPVFASTEVGQFSDDGQLLSTRSVAAPMTVLDLLRHTSGISYDSPAGLGELYAQHRLRSGALTLPRFVEELATLPLAEDPGTRFRYSLSTDVLGRVIEVVSGQPLETVLQERVFDPLGMSDTSFVVVDDDLPRFASIHRHRNGRLEVAESAEDSPLRRPPVAVSGGGGWGDTGSLGGAVTTAGDYLLFLQMLLDGGEANGVRILGRKTVELMTIDHLGELDGPSPGTGFGLGFGVIRDPGQTHQLGSPGAYYWGGSENTSFWVDPKEELIGLFFTQLTPFGHADIVRRFRTLVYQALE